MSKKLKLFVIRTHYTGTVGEYGENTEQDGIHIVLARSPLEARILLRKQLGLPAMALAKHQVDEYPLPTTPCCLLTAYGEVSDYNIYDCNCSQVTKLRVYLEKTDE
ncbi:MAG: hypothetical protein EBR79_00835 [Proteobacteria bacterium]|nr:hypothetical protein [Pseudomonadota bacterium]NBX86690.1 hypothetical protein [Pseudomonadota bacterium]